MYGVSFRPHKLQVVTRTGGGTDKNGVPQPDTESTVEIPCRFEPNGSARQIPFQDGTARIYSYTVYLNHDCMTLKVGDKVRLIDGDGNAIENDREFRVLGFHRYQLNARIWV